MDVVRFSDHREPIALRTIYQLCLDRQRWRSNV